jgi:hypothetical protein
MIFTFFVEIFLGIYTIYKDKKSTIRKIAVATLFLLATFQIAEFFVCGNSDRTSSIIAVRFGYIAITLLPPLVIHLASEIAGVKKNQAIKYIYTLATAFILFFAFFPGAITTTICTGNYVVFSLAKYANVLYGTYYFGLLLGAIAYSFYLATKQKNRKIFAALNWLIAGNLVFLLPTGLFYFVAPSTAVAIPSVMCGFAILYAVILVWKIMPLVSKQK